MEKYTKHRSGSTKRKEKERRLLEEVATNLKQAKVSTFFRFRSTSQENKNKVPFKNEVLKEQINEFIVLPSTSISIYKNESISVESSQSQPFVTILGQSESLISTTQINHNQIEEI